MRTSTRVEAAIHCCVVLTWAQGHTLTTGQLADLFGLPPAYLNKTLQALAKAGVTESVPGNRGGFALARSATAVSLMDIVAAIEGRDPLFRCQEIRQGGTAAATRVPVEACGIARAMGRADAAYRRELASQTLAEVASASGTGPKRRALAALGL
ncbi:RrF2 family transcriptional regulator [Rhodococcus sp. NPDC058521]|uniref:RrF2 family transcriptional regulator n=1 Tax=Rhodococcus sp. NPDC058521 TaxID=3346536 RepID=UPI00365BAF8D